MYFGKFSTSNVTHTAKRRGGHIIAHTLVNATVRGGTEITKTPADLKTNDRERIFLVKKKEKVAISERLLLRQFYPTFVFLPRLPFFYPALRFFTPPSVFLPRLPFFYPSKL